MTARRLAAIAALLVASAAEATPPSLLTYSGYLAKSSGAPVTSATTLVFSFYSGAASSTPVWQDTVTVTPTADGWFSAIIGTNSLNPLLPTDFAQDLWLGIRVSTEPAEMSPRTELTSTPYALTTEWTNVMGRPSAFPPEPHQHAGTDITSAVAAASSVPWSGVTGAPSTFPPSAHQHPGTDITSKVASATTADSAASVPWTGVGGKPATFPPSAHQHPGSDITSAVAAASTVPWGGVTGAPAFLTTVSRDGTLVGDGVGTPLGVNAGAVQARIGTTCGAGQYMYGVDVAGAPICRADQNSGGTVTSVTGVLPITVSGSATAPTVGLAIGGGVAVSAGLLAADFGGSGTQAKVAHADHTHLIVVALPLNDMFIGSGAPTKNAVPNYGGQGAMPGWDLPAGASIKAIAIIPSNAASRVVNVRLALSTRSASGNVVLQVRYTGLPTAAGATCGFGSTAATTIPMTQNALVSRLIPITTASSVPNSTPPDFCGPGPDAAAGDSMFIEIFNVAGATSNLDVMAVQLEFT